MTSTNYVRYVLIHIPKAHMYAYFMELGASALHCYWEIGIFSFVASSYFSGGMCAFSAHSQSKHLSNSFLEQHMHET